MTVTCSPSDGEAVLRHGWLQASSNESVTTRALDTEVRERRCNGQQS